MKRWLRVYWNEVRRPTNPTWRLVWKLFIGLTVVVWLYCLVSILVGGDILRLTGLAVTFAVMNAAFWMTFVMWRMLHDGIFNWIDRRHDRY